MVGVPHSTGCALCRERHIKCDEAIPGCSQCQRYGRDCPGYRRTYRFQDEGPSLARRNRSLPRRRGRAQNSTVATQTPALTVGASSPHSRQIEALGPVKQPDEEGAGVATVVRDSAIALMRRHSAAIALDENISPSLVRKSFKAAQPQLFLDFISASFPTLYFHNRFRAGREGFAEHIVLNFGQDAYLDSAICCLSSVYLAHLTQDPVLLRTSRRMYGVSLGEMVRALSIADQAMSDNMLCASMMLSVYEMYAQTSPGAWVVHSDAVRRLMTSRGAGRHKTGFGKSCWIAFRGFHVATAVYQGKPCFLDEDEWQDYALEMMAEDSQKLGEWAAYAVISDKVFMEIAKCPRYLSEGKSLLSSSTKSNQVDSEDLIQRIQDTSRRLYIFSSELRTCISAHSQRQQGIIRRPGTFVGPVPEIFPETGPSLLLCGAENIQGTLRQLCDHLEGRRRCQIIEDSSPRSGTSTLSDGSIDTPSPPVSSDTITLPFRIYSELGRGPSKTSDRNDPRAVIWLDRVASSMGVIGTKLIPENVSLTESIEEGAQGGLG
ncbi:hypothetical protein N7454_008425 [Penicillium verhagenii]|nr:hypothetical protein N7454_008425 [Penicillium verhagenii]